MAQNQRTSMMTLLGSEEEIEKNCTHLTAVTMVAYYAIQDSQFGDPPNHICPIMQTKRKNATSHKQSRM